MDSDAANDNYSGALEVTVRRSRIVSAFVVLAAASTLLLIGVLALGACAAVLLATTVACLGLDALRRESATRRLTIGRDAAVSIDGRAGRLQPGSLVAPWLTIVRWRPAGARFDRTLLIVPDMLPAADLRHLRVLLKWG